MSSPTPPPFGQRDGQPHGRNPRYVKTPKWVWITLAVIVLAIIGSISNACSDHTDASSTTPATTAAYTAAETFAAPQTTTTTEAAVPTAPITVPNLVGENAAIAESQLKKLGFKDIETASGTPGVQMVLLLSNWAVESVEPGVGTQADLDSPIVLTVVKKNR